ncbi:DUF2785 domain-containing protein [Luteimonas vadosa]|uniref:DUF2785 domain-containing protein n=1 Tax=Luteimonas vadosa TaxID=1165507 RepID=A0ABP9EAW4_9GAMM
MRALKAQEFVLEDARERLEWVELLVDCLGDPDPAVRDAIAYEGLATWLRAAELDAAALRALRERLYALLDGDPGEGFARPFAALLLSEVARTDRIAPWMTLGERAAMVDAAADYVEGVRDYRGFDNVEGWRHGVAHGADWLMQLALNPALDRGHHDRLLAAVAVQAVPENAHAYVFGEPARLARPVVFIASRGLRSEAEWTDWFAALATRLGDPALAYADAAWLARRHDLSAFLTALYIEADRSENPGVQALKPATAAALERLP